MKNLLFVAVILLLAAPVSADELARLGLEGSTPATQAEKDAVRGQGVDILMISSVSASYEITFKDLPVPVRYLENGDGPFVQEAFNGEGEGGWGERVLTDFTLRASVAETVEVSGTYHDLKKALYGHSHGKKSYRRHRYPNPAIYTKVSLDLDEIEDALHVLGLDLTGHGHHFDVSNRVYLPLQSHYRRSR